MVKDYREKNDGTLHLPRILCLHGGGTNARIFKIQCRVLERALQSRFRLCFAEAPFPSQAGPDVTSVYKDFGPFRAWLRWSPEDPLRDSKSALERIEESLRSAMIEDDRWGATGEWVALLGFSQGAKMCASMFFAQQIRLESHMKQGIWPNFRFAVLMAGRAPLVSLDSETARTPGLVDASCLSSLDYPGEERMALSKPLLHLPTIHVHGLQDPGLHLHRKLLQYCDQSTTKLIEWDGNHRIPIKSKDVKLIVDEVLLMARETRCPGFSV